MKKIFFYFVFSLNILTLLVASRLAQADTAGKIVITMQEAGGNGAAYGLTALNGPTNRTQIFSCPRGSSGIIPDGRIQCDTTYGSTVSSEWQPGDTLTISAQPEGSAEIPYELRSGGIYLCRISFKGWTGSWCQGMGTYNATRNMYECSFTLPQHGNVEIGAKFSGNDSDAPCPAISNPAPTATAGPVATPTTRPLDPLGNKVLDALTAASENLADSLNLKSVIRGTVKFLIPKTAEFSYDVSVSVRAVSEGTSPLTVSESLQVRKKIKLEPIGNKPIIASGRGKSSKVKSLKLKLPSTPKGIKVATGRKSLGIQITVTTKGDGQTIPKIVTTRTIH